MSNDSSTSLRENGGKSQSKKVVINLIGVCEAMDPFEWPSGEFLQKNICGHVELTKHSISTSEASRLCNLDAKCWQAAARYSLLKKYGYSIPSISSSPIELTVNEIQIVQQRWNEVINEVNACSSDDLDVNKFESAEKFENNDPIREASVSTIEIDFVDFIKSQCCFSNNRRLEWSLMLCPPGVQFQLHAHPNIELIYCIRGALYEVRMNGPPLSRHFEKFGSGCGDNTMTKVAGPELTHVQRSWSFDTLRESQWLVNEVGSIHKSFTSSKSDGGCDLLVLWGGSHANISDPPITPNVQKAVDFIDERLRGDRSTEINEFCCSEGNVNAISATFLPESERSGIL